MVTPKMAVKVTKRDNNVKKRLMLNKTIFKLKHKYHIDLLVAYSFLTTSLYNYSVAYAVDRFAIFSCHSRCYLLRKLLYLHCLYT